MIIRSALFAALLLAGPAGAQVAPPAPPQAGDIVVTAGALPPEQAVRRLTRAIAKRSDQQVARFEEPVCPDALGLPPAYNALVVRRIRTTAARAGIPVAGEGCRANATVLIVESGKAILDEDDRTGQRLTRSLTDAERRLLLAQKGPARAWNVTELRSRDGNRLIGGTLFVDNASILGLPTRRDIVGSLLLLDRAALIGKTLTQIADYAAMRTLAQTRDAVGEDRATILSLFAGGATAPAGLTTFDAAYLKALYEGPATMPYHVKVQQIARRINAAEAPDPD